MSILVHLSVSLSLLSKRISSFLVSATKHNKKGDDFYLSFSDLTFSSGPNVGKFTAYTKQKVRELQRENGRSLDSPFFLVPICTHGSWPR